MKLRLRTIALVLIFIPLTSFTSASSEGCLAMQVRSMEPTGITDDHTPTVRIVYEFPPDACLPSEIGRTVFVDGVEVPHVEEFTSTQFTMAATVTLEDGEHMAYFRTGGTTQAWTRYDILYFRIAAGAVTLFDSDIIELTPTTPLPNLDQTFGAVIVEDQGNLLCVLLQVSEQPPQSVACVNRLLLGPSDALIPRQRTNLTLDAPGQLDSRRFSIHAQYLYDPAHLFVVGSVAGTSILLPFAPGDEEWFLNNGNELSLIIEYTIYEGDRKSTRTMTIDWIGQVLAATSPLPAT